MCVDEVESWREVFRTCVKSAWGLWRIGRLESVLNERKEEGHNTLTPAGCGDSPADSPTQREAHRRALTAAWETQKRQKKTHFVCLATRCLQEIFTHRGEQSKRCRDECCAVAHAPEGFPLLIQGPERTKQRCPRCFAEEDRKGGASREGLMTGLLILSVHPKHQRALETFGWKSGECLELFLVLYETGD